MRIVHIITRLIIGGAQENTLLSCEGQRARGHDVTLMTGPTAGPEGTLMDRAMAGGYRVIELPSMVRAIQPWNEWRAYRALIERLRELKPDIVHTHSSKAGILGRWAANAANVPRIVHTIHGLAFTASTSAAVNGVYKFLERKTARITDKIVCVADAMSEQSLAANIGYREQYVTVYSGMDVTPFLSPAVPRAEARASVGVTDDSLILVGTIARLFDLKGHDDLIDLAPALCATFPRLRFLWVGDGALRAAFEARIAQLGLTDRFIFTGLVPPARIPELAGTMDILVHPSRREGLARALPQGALAGKPVVTYDIDGAKEAVIDGQTGFVIPPFDKPKLGDALATLLGNAALRQTMGAHGRQLAVSRFDAPVMIDGLERMYSELMAMPIAPRKSKS